MLKNRIFKAFSMIIGLQTHTLVSIASKISSFRWKFDYAEQHPLNDHSLILGYCCYFFDYLWNWLHFLDTRVYNSPILSLTDSLSDSLINVIFWVLHIRILKYAHRTSARLIFFLFIELVTTTHWRKSSGWSMALSRLIPWGTKNIFTKIQY